MSEETNLENNTSFPLWKTLPSVVTMFALCMGLTSIKFSFTGNIEMAVIFILIAAFLDGIDGRVARLLGCSSVFGAQLDSLSDLLNFGAAPALLLYCFALSDVRVFGWAFAMLFVICIAIRLARFNASEIAENEHKRSWETHFFEGIPAPAAAILLTFPIVLSFHEVSLFSVFLKPVNLIIYIVCVSAFAVSHVPTFSLKGLKVHRRFISLVLAVFSVIVIAITVKPWIMLPVICITYIFTIPISIALYYYMFFRINE